MTLGADGLAFLCRMGDDNRDVGVQKGSDIGNNSQIKEEQKGDNGVGGRR